MKFGLEQHIIDTFIEVFEGNSKVDKAYVFGSRAKGNFRPDSDIDIVIKGQDLNTDDIIAMSVAFETHGITNKIDLLDYKIIKELALKEHIDRVGIEFYSRWKKVMLQDVVSKLGDGLHGTPEYDVNGEYYFINGNNLIDGKIVLKENTQRITENEYIKYKKELNDRTILLGINGTIGNVALYNGEKCVLGKSACYFNVIDSVSRDYIKYIVLDKTFQSYIENFANGSTIMNVSLKVIREYEFSLPPIKEQISIASILKSLDEKIDLLYRQNKTLEQLAEMLFRQWFVEEAEESWVKKSLYDVIELIGGGTPKTEVAEYWDGNIQWLSCGDIASNHKSFVISSEKAITDLGLQNSSTRLLPKFSMAITARGTVGKYCLLSEPMAFSQSNYGIKPKYEGCYFFTYLLVAQCVDELQSAAYGSVFDTITTNTFKEQKVKLPEIDEIMDFEEKIKPYFQKIYNNQIQIRTLAQARDMILPKLMSGEVRVNLKS